MMTCLHHLHLSLIVGETLEEANQLVNIILETILQGTELINVYTAEQISSVIDKVINRELKSVRSMTN